MNSKKIYKIIILIMIAIVAFALHSVSYAETERITKDLKINSYYSSSNEGTYGCYIEKDGEPKALSIDATKFNLPSNLYKYRDDIRLRITYTESDYTVYECKVINYKTGEIIEDLSEEKIEQLFNIEYGKDIIEKTWSDKIKLSELKENEIYKYTANSTTQFPEIENDVEKNCIIYIKQKFEENYNKEINMFKKISSLSISVSYNEYNPGETFYIMYKSANTSELLDLIEEDDIIYLSKYNDGDQLQYKFEDYIYNDTDKDITVNVKDKLFGLVENYDSVVIGKDEIYGFDWTIDSATISYAKANNVEDNNTDEENNKDNTVAQSSRLPKAGTSSIVISMILITTVIMIIIWTKSRKLKDIK